MDSLEFDILSSLYNINWKNIFDLFRTYQRDVMLNLELMRDGANIYFDPMEKKFVTILYSKNTPIKYYYRGYPIPINKQFEFEENVTYIMTKQNLDNLYKNFIKKNGIADLVTLSSIKIIEKFLNNQYLLEKESYKFTDFVYKTTDILEKI